MECEEVRFWDLAIFYNDSLYEETIVDVITIGLIESGVEIFEIYDGEITVEKIDSNIL